MSSTQLGALYNPCNEMVSKFSLKRRKGKMQILYANLINLQVIYYLKWFKNRKKKKMNQQKSWLIKDS